MGNYRKVSSRSSQRENNVILSTIRARLLFISEKES